jgi:uncharacterized protein with PQ loop repeat
MVHDIKGQHHYSKRKRLFLGLEQYPHPEKMKRWMDKAVLGVGVIGPIMTIPQIIKIYFYRNASGVSVISWATYLLCALVWFNYGILHKDKAIMLTYALWIILDVLVVYGAVTYSITLL